MGRVLWLPDVLREAGLAVHEVDGWRGRGAESFGPVLGVIAHETQGSLKSTDAGEIGVLVNGSRTASPPIAQLYLSRSGQWWVVASGTCTGVRLGTAGPLEGLGDDAVLQIEAQHAQGEPWTDVQYRSYVTGVAALVRKLGCGVAKVVGHKEHQPGQKTDPGFGMDGFRRDVAAALEDDVDPITKSLIEGAAWRMEAVLRGFPTVQGGPTKGEENKLFQRLAAQDEKLGQLADAVGRLATPVIDYDALAGALARAGLATDAGVRDAVGDGLEGGAAAVRADAG